MWILNVLPDFIFHTIVIFGVLGVVASFFFTFVPFISKYKLPVQIVSIIALVIGIYFEGAISNQNHWELKVAEAEKHVLELQVQSSEANTKLAEQIAENEKLRKDKKYATQTIVTQVVSKYDSNCTLSNAFVRVHNSASQDKVPDSTAVTDGNASNVKPSELLNTIVDNYETCYAIRDKLIKWQEWYKTQQKIYE